MKPQNEPLVYLCLYTSLMVANKKHYTYNLNATQIAK